MKYAMNLTKRTEIEVELEAEDHRAAARKFRSEHGQFPDAIEVEGGGGPCWHVVAVCERCEAPIFLGEAYSTDEDGSVSMCGDCCAEVDLLCHMRGTE